MLDVVAVVEEQQVVDAAVVAGRAARVFVVALELAEPETEQQARQVDREEELRRERSPAPPRARPTSASSNAIAGASAQNARCEPGVMRQMPRAPERLRKAEEQAQDAEYTRSAERARKNGRWMKLCAMVFAFHHMPIAMIAIDGTAQAARRARPRARRTARPTRDSAGRAGLEVEVGATDVPEPIITLPS